MSLQDLTSQSTVTVERQVSARDAGGGVSNTWSTHYSGVQARIEDASAAMVDQWQRRQINVTHEMLTRQPGIGIGMRVKETFTGNATVLAQGAQTSTVTSSATDMDGAPAVNAAAQTVTAISGTTPTLAGKMQESDDGATGWSDITGASFAAIALSAVPVKQTIVFQRSKRYVRYVGTITGTNPSFNVGVEIQPSRYYLVQSCIEERPTGGIPYYAEVMLEEQRGRV